MIYHNLPHDVLKTLPNKALCGQPLRLFVLSAALKTAPPILAPMTADQACAHYIYLEDHHARLAFRTQHQQTAAKQGFQPKVNPFSLQPEEYVYIHDNKKAKQNHRKFDPHWLGPFHILRQVKQNVYDDCTCRGRCLQVVHVNQMKRLAVVQRS